MPFRLLTLALLTLAASFAAGCSWKSTDKCYLPQGRYRAMKAVFEESGSMQRVEQAMEDAKWADCERNQFRYQMAKELHIDDLEWELEFGTGES